MLKKRQWEDGAELKMLTLKIMMQPQAKECCQPPGATRDKEQIFPRDPREFRYADVLISVR